MLEPRRLAARAAAARMAATLGEAVGETVGYRGAVRLEGVARGPASRSSPRACSPAWSSTIRRSTASRRVLFDEFHERSLDADLGLALARDVQQGLREDLRLLVMSATIDGARVAAAARRCAGDREPGPRLPGRDALSRPRRARADRARRSPTRSRGRCAPTPARCWCSCPARPKSAAPKRCCASASTIRRSISCRSTARSTPTCRTAPSRRRRPAAARSCWRPRSPKPR